MSGVATMRDVEAIEARGAPDLPASTYEMIYKPALKRKEAKDALESALREAEVKFRALDVVDDAVRGMVAKLEIEDAGSSARAREVLGRFPVPFTISWPLP